MKKRNLLVFGLAISSIFALGTVACGGPAPSDDPHHEDDPHGGEEDVSINTVEITVRALSVDIGETKTLIAHVYPSNARQDVEWTSGNPSIATVDANGAVTGVAAGTCVVIAKSKADNTKVSTCTVTVNEPLPEATKTVKLTFRHSFGQTVGGNVQTRIKEFENLVLRNERVKVEVTMVGSSNYTSLESDIRFDFKKGEVPSIAIAYPDHVANYMADGGDDPLKYVVRLDDLISNPNYGLGTEEYLGDYTTTAGGAKQDICDLDDVVDAYLEEGQNFTQPGLFTFPFMKSTEAMYYNLKLVRSALKLYRPDISTDRQIKDYMDNLTWDEFMNFSDFIIAHKAEVSPNITNAAYYDSDANLMITKMHQSNIPYSSIRDGKGYIDYADSPNKQLVIDFMESLKPHYDNKAFTTKGAEGTYGSYDFKDGTTVFTIGSTGGAGYNITNDFDIGVTKVPTFGDRPLYVSQGPSFVIMKNPKNTEAVTNDQIIYSFKLLKYLTNTNVNADLAFFKSEGYLPVRESAYYSDEYIRFTEAGGYLVDTCAVTTDLIQNRFLSTACFKGSSTLRKQTGDMLATFLTGKATANDAIDMAKSNSLMQMEQE